MQNQLFSKNSAAICFLDKIMTEKIKCKREELPYTHISFIHFRGRRTVYIANSDQNYPFSMAVWFSLVGILKEV